MITNGDNGIYASSETMPGLGLALSGGGFRATLYHLGVVRFLRDAGKLQQVSDIASVSGGSILAAHLALNWDRYTGDDESFAQAASEVIKLVQFDVRNHIVRRLPMQIPLRFLTRLHLFKRRRATPNAILERYYRTHLYGDRCLYELPEHPMLHILTTNVSTGVLSVFNRNGLFMARRGNAAGQKFAHIPGMMASIPRIVAASSAFPGFFPPVEISAADLGVPEGEFPSEFFTDGGVYDNMGLRAFSWLEEQEAHFEHVLVSDAGQPFQMLTDAALGMFGQSVRASDILWDRVWQLEREIFGHRKGFVFLPITEIVDLAEDPTALPPVVQTELKSIRTDLDRFSNQEINALAQHGYEVARKVCHQQGIFDGAKLPESPPWAPIADQDGIIRTSAGARSDTPSSTTRLSRRLRKSGHRRIWTTLLSWRDWPSYVYVVIAFLLLFYAPFQVYSLYQRSQIQAGIIDAIASGDPDVRQILDLVDSNPTSNWIDDEVGEIAAPTELNYEGVEVLTDSRTYDLRWWHPDGSLANRRGLVYLRDRITLKRVGSYSGSNRVTFAFSSLVEKVKIRKSNEKIPRVVRRVAKPVEVGGEKRTLYEFEYDLSQVPPEEPVTIEGELLLLDVPEAAQARFMTGRRKTDLISIWILFPSDRPYKNYSLVSYPQDRSVPPKITNARYKIDHPYGSLIGWSVVNPKTEYVYECRWEMQD